ncbi:DUF6193 family natural product biosynthesis protein [Streptomyces sp. SYSU K217416]
MPQENRESSAHETVRARWNAVLGTDTELIDPALTAAAHEDPLLRQLLPLVSHGSLQFSRCVRFPLSNDVPALFPRIGGGFRVLRMWEPRGSDRHVVGEADSPTEAVALVVAHLPAGCGPAIDGTADDLNN